MSTSGVVRSAQVTQMLFGHFECIAHVNPDHAHLKLVGFAKTHCQHVGKVCDAQLPLCFGLLMRLTHAGATSLLLGKASHNPSKNQRT